MTGQYRPCTQMNTQGDSDVISMPAGYCRHRVGKTLINVFHCYSWWRGTGWWRGTVVERRSLAGELSLSCARPAADG